MSRRRRRNLNDLYSRWGDHLRRCEVCSRAQSGHHGFCQVGVQLHQRIEAREQASRSPDPA